MRIMVPGSSLGRDSTTYRCAVPNCGSQYRTTPSSCVGQYLGRAMLLRRLTKGGTKYAGVGSGSSIRKVSTKGLVVAYARSVPAK
eukprot:1096624-Rhodomonas_salina.1